MARLVDRAVARQVATSKLSLYVVDGDRKPARQQVVPVAADRFVAAEAERMGVAPPGRPTHHDRPSRQPVALAS